MSEVTIKFHVSLRNFKGNSSGESLGTWELSVSSLEDLISKLWSKISSYIQREIVFVNERPTWHEKLGPTIEDISRYVCFSTKTLGKRSYEINQLSMAILESWTDRKVDLYVYKHSNSISSLKLYKKAEGFVKEEAGGGDFDSILQDIIDQLQKFHFYHYNGLEQSWQLWAKWILDKKPDDPTDLIQGAPPQELRHCFESAKGDAEERLENIALDARVAQSVNSSFSNLLPNFDATLENAFGRRSHLLDELNSFCSTLGSTFKGIRKQ